MGFHVVWPLYAAAVADLPRLTGGSGASEARVLVDSADVAAPFAVKRVEEPFSRGFAAGHNLAQRRKIAGLVIPGAIEPCARLETRCGDVEDRGAQLLQVAATRSLRLEAEL